MLEHDRRLRQSASETLIKTLTPKILYSYPRLYGPKKLVIAISVQAFREAADLFHLFNTDIVEVRLRDVQYKLHVIGHDKGISRDLRIFGIWEPFWAAYMLSAVKKGMVAVDVGANLGYYALLMSQLAGENGGIIALEPDPLNFRFLLKNIALNKAENIHPYNCAASNVNGKLYLSRSRYASGWSTVSATPGNTYIRTDAARLDDFLPTLVNRFDIVKLDVEGHEIEVVDGMRRMIKDLLPTIFMELHFEENARRNKSGEMLETLSFLDKYYIADFVIPRRLNNHYAGSIRNVWRSLGVASLAKLSPHGQLSTVMKPR